MAATPTAHARAAAGAQSDGARWGTAPPRASARAVPRRPGRPAAVHGLRGEGEKGWESVGGRESSTLAVPLQKMTQVPAQALPLEGVGGVHMQTPALGPQSYHHPSLDPALCFCVPWTTFQLAPLS